MRKIIIMSVLGVTSLLSVSCDTTSGALGGAGVGGLVGGLVGNQSGHPVTGALIGAGAGAAVGGMAGNANERVTRLEQQNAQQNAYNQGLRDGRY
jgi:uncharacterized protein YcfJ